MPHSLLFAGGDVELPLNRNMTDHALAFWFLTTSANERWCFGGFGNNNYGVRVRPSDNFILIGTNGGVRGFATGIDIDDGMWHHVVANWNSGSSLGLFVDGVDRGVEAVSFTQSLLTYFGRRPAGSHFVGNLDDVRRYSAPLDAEQAAALSAGGEAAAIVENYWTCNEGSGSAVNDIVSGINGTINGSVSWSTDEPFGTSASATPRILSPYLIGDVG